MMSNNWWWLPLSYSTQEKKKREKERIEVTKEHHVILPFWQRQKGLKYQHKWKFKNIKEQLKWQSQLITSVTCKNKVQRKRYIDVKEYYKENIAYLRQEVSKIPSSLQILRKGSDGSGSVNISASWNLVSTYSKDTSFFSTWSLRKWCWISICLVLECKTGFFVRLIALLVLSHLIGT